MKVLVTGSAGHLGEALVRTLEEEGHEAVGLDILVSPFTAVVGSITDRALVRRAMAGVETVFHAATLHKPHVATHSRQDFVDTNMTGTLALLEEAAAARARAFVYTKHHRRLRRRAAAARRRAGLGLSQIYRQRHHAVLP